MELNNSGNPSLAQYTPATDAIPSFSGIDASSSLRSNRRRSRSTRISERESLEEEIKQTVKTLRAQVDTERRRADNAERKVREMTAHLKVVNDARLEALRDAGRAKEELRLYIIQLDTAQREIYRAQDVITIVDKQRHSAEKEAAKNRSKARQLNETILVQAARDEAYRLGMKEGLTRGREIAMEDVPFDEAEEEFDEESVDESRSPSPSPQSQGPSYSEPPRPRSMVAPSRRSGQSRTHSRPEASPSPLPVPLPKTNPPPSVGAPSLRAPTNHAPSVHAPSMRAPSSYAVSARAPSVRAPSPSVPPAAMSSFRPPSMRGPSPQPTVGEPSAHAYTQGRRASSINLSEQMGRPVNVRTVTPVPQHPAVVLPPDNFIPVLGADQRIRLPPPHEFIAHTPDRAQSPILQAPSESSQDALSVRPKAHTPQQQRTSRHRRNSSSGSSSLSHLDLVNNPYIGGLRTPMSVIKEVNSQTASPNTHQSMQHQRSFSENSSQHGRPPSNYGGDTHSHHRPSSKASYAGSWNQPQGPSPRDGHSGQRSPSFDAPSINVQAPSLSNKSDSARGGTSQVGTSPAPSHRAPLSSVHEEAESSRSHGQAAGMPGSYTTDYYAAYLRSPSTEPPVVPKITPIHYDQGGGHSRYDDDDAVSSALSADTLTTPITRHRAPTSDWGDGGTSDVSQWHMPQPPIGVTYMSTVGESN